MRIRTIKPDFWQDEECATLSRDARLVYIAMWNEADDDGRLRGSAKYLRAVLFPYDDDLQMGKILLSLRAHGKIIEYSVRAQTYLFLPNFRRHQRINRPSASRLPEPPEKALEDHDLKLNSLRAHGSFTEGSPPEMEMEMEMEVEGKSEKEVFSDHVNRVTILAMDFFNAETGHRHRATAKGNRDLIRKLMKKKITIEEIKKVISAKAREWKGDQKMDRQLIPDVVLGPKFFKYLRLLDEMPSVKDHDLPLLKAEKRARTPSLQEIEEIKGGISTRDL